MSRRTSAGIVLALIAVLMVVASSGTFYTRLSAQAAEVAPLRPFEPAPKALPGFEPLPALDLRSAPQPRRVSREACGPEGARVVRFRVHVQRGVPFGTKAFARTVRSILCDPRGWTASGAVRFRYDPRGEYLVSLRTPATTEARCMSLIGLSVRSTWSCAGTREAVLNSARWLHGSPSLPMRVRPYRRLLVNHEVGHLLGHGHRSCPGPGERAPVMMQQSKGLWGCRGNPWPLRSELAATS
ncbi:MAG TPA: DUF3152 domain-containing protein [Actinomycetota bacterium]